MRLSIVIPVLNSHEILKRQVLHWQRIGIPNDVEIILMDDGSDPPIGTDWPVVQIYQTHDYRPWTWALARNAGARIAKGEYLLMTDFDYIIPRKAIDDALQFNGDKMRFHREFGVLLQDGTFTQDYKILMEYGLTPERIRERGTHMPPHPNNFVMRKRLFWDMGGYREDLIHKPYPQGEDRYFKKVWAEWLKEGRVKDHDHRPTLYMFPNGQFCGDVDYNPFDLFHSLSRKTDENPWHKRILEGLHR